MKHQDSPAGHRSAPHRSGSHPTEAGASSGEAPDRSPRICDYEGSPYQQRFWQDADRSYEDAAERLALRDLLPPTGQRLVEIGVGFGRLADEYRGYEQIILLDYAQSMLRQARERLGDRAIYVCADLYRLPFADRSVSTVTQIRVLHHVERPTDALAEVARVLRAGGSYVLEFANKRNLKSIARYAFGRQEENPFDRTPWEFVDLNWNFHPVHIDRLLADAGLTVRQRRAVSLFRHPIIKRALPAEALAATDHALGRPLARLAPAPSQFVRATPLTGGPPSEALWRCPNCGSSSMITDDDGHDCSQCGRRWPIEDGIHIFR